jgi:uncharacterized protein YjbI with pentapeptide repeats
MGLILSGMVTKLANGDCAPFSLTGVSMRSMVWLGVWITFLSATVCHGQVESYRGAKLPGRDFQGQTLVGADFQDADLTAANFNDAILTAAIFRSANLSRASLSRADLSNADLRGVDLTQTGLQAANFSGANLEGIDFKQASLFRCVLRGANLRNAIGIGQLDFADFRDADLRGANLLQMKDYNGTSAKFDGAKYDDNTRWPPTFDVAGSRAVKVASEPSATVPTPPTLPPTQGMPLPASPAPQSETTSLPPNAADPAATFQRGDLIDVSILGGWDKAVILEVGQAEHAGQYKVHYEGYSNDYDRWLQPLYFRKRAPSTPGTAPANALTYQMGEAIEVNVLGTWDKATILEVGSGAHEGEFKVHYDGYSSNYDRWLHPTYFRKRSGVTPPANMPQIVIPGATPTDPSKPIVSPGPSGASAPRLGKYNISSYGAVGTVPLFLGQVELIQGGKYRVSRTRGPDYYGAGEYKFSGSKVEWLSGPFKEEGWDGAFKIEENGITHKITLRRGTIATNTPE